MTTNAPTSDPLLAAVRQGIVVHDLGRPLSVGMSQSPNHPAYWHAFPRRHGDMVRSDGGSAANDFISMGTHVGTHIDALAHVSQDGLLHGGVDAREAGVGGRYLEHGVHTIEPMVRRGVLLDVPATLGLAEGCPAGYEITVADLEATVERQGVEVEEGDVVLIRSGWGRHFDDPDPSVYRGASTGVPGVSEAGARWLAERRVHAVGADTIAFEMLAPGAGHGLLPAHRVLLVESGIYIIEALDLDGPAAAGHHEFTFILSPLAFVGATGSPVRPLAVVSRG
ncbi:cyclase family protein [Nocardioides marmotae]|uniref:Cyclase family protein n=1 Tax=Nocardioides marmotae TaxID=2663857 RepID=A0A6I3J4X9_9ACTN|nr:cyclase family protein [Nocardioides marmotae]MCR6030508.1 cyclase family protein [Gordonia jinghuaiqii]MBC9734639.1 cyclase family protein [Nocardioides marmotae]MTB85741.1 cyclase family protein [Nocardioides marmotae]MTB94144.1 cyclase family protein [Nocardioides marmotae]QKE00440.1 cyclase family protein [Nocardioides marmotae]